MPLERFQIYQVRQPRDYLDRPRSRSRAMFMDVRSFAFLEADRTLLRTNGIHLHGVRVAVVGSSGHRIHLNDAVFVPLRGKIEVKRQHCQNVAQPGEMIIATPGERVTSLGKDYLGIVILLPIDELDRSDALLCSERLARSAVNMIADLVVERCVTTGPGRTVREPVKLGSDRQVRLAEEFMRANLEPVQ